jgi:N4-gp56 family major capsid protein
MSGKTATSRAAAMYVQAAAIFGQSMQRNSTLSRLSGPMPKSEAQVASVIERQTTADLPIVRSVDLSRGKGDEVEFHFVQPVGAYPIMGSKMAEGKGVGIQHDNSRVRVNQARFPVDLGDTMDELRSPIQIAKIGKPIAQSLMDRYQDQLLLTHLAGARGFHDNIEWCLPTSTHPEFAEMAVNPVLAPTRNRHYLADGTNGIKEFGVSATEVDIASTDVLDMDTVDATRSMIETIALPPPAVKIPGDVAAEDSPLRVMLVSPEQYHTFAKDKDFRTFQANAIARASKAKNHPLFLGDCGLWNGILLMKMPKPIRFYAGDEVRYCAAYDSAAESVATVPASFGTTHAIDRAILLGGQALAHAFGKSKHGGLPFFWKEKTFDHDDKEELLIGAVHGVQKLRWLVNQGGGIKHFTDHGAVAIDTAVRILKPRG